MFKITADAGHGGNDRTNRGPSGYIEADGALQRVKLLKSKLESTGMFQVTLTRDCDKTLSLTERAKIAIDSGADLFISDHSNAGIPEAGGAEVYYSVDIPEDGRLSRMMSANISAALGIKDRGARIRESTRYPGEDYYTVIDVAQDGGVPHVLLIENAFHSNPAEEKLLMDSATVDKLEDAKAKAICDFFGVPYNSSIKTPENLLKPLPKPMSRPTDKGNQNIRIMQALCNSLGIRDMNGRTLAVDGLTGPRTRYAVERLPLCGLKFVQRSATRYTQTRLNQLGYRDNSGSKLTVDGIFGRRSAEAVTKFQRAHGLKSDGIVGRNTWLKFLG